MGSMTLLFVEMANPGTLDGIIAFEPTFDDGSFVEEDNIPIRDAIVRACIARQEEWDSWDEMLQHLKSSREFRRWDSEVLTEFLKQGVEKTEDGKRWRLVPSPRVVAALYSAKEVKLLAEDFAKAKCKIVFEHAEFTVFFHDDSIQALAQQLNGQLIVSEVIPGSTHSVCVELPAVCAERILKGLQHFPVFQEATAQAKL